MKRDQGGRQDSWSKLMEQAHGASLDSLVIELLFRIRATIPRDLGEIGSQSGMIEQDCK